MNYDGAMRWSNPGDDQNKDNRVSVAIDEYGRGSVVVNGHDISNMTRSVSIEAEVGTVTKVALELVPHHCDLVGQAEVLADVLNREIDVTEHGDTRRILLCPCCGEKHEVDR